MDIETHKILAQNALIKAKELFDSDDIYKQRELLHFAHVARLHFEYSSILKTEEEFLENIKKSDEFLIQVYEKLKLPDAANFIRKAKWLHT